ncbi:hypothetical protein [Calothrix sp. UHCC 0171]|nr:hypothetical protein [Calothrix sp. UHCC 0171]MEA5572141.1 hypothetical protein [Calothrix sp. UHCC 0171]
MKLFAQLFVTILFAAIAIINPILAMANIPTETEVKAILQQRIEQEK